ncbi:hypothetical protein D3C74_172220 [compost metagenome]
MLYAVRGNKQLKIEEMEKTSFLNQGYDIAEELDGQLVTLEVSLSKTVPYAEYKKLLDQLESAGDMEKIEALQKENKVLKEKLAEANKKLKEAGKE